MINQLQKDDISQYAHTIVADLYHFNSTYSPLPLREIRSGVQWHSHLK